MEEIIGQITKIEQPDMSIGNPFKDKVKIVLEVDEDFETCKNVLTTQTDKINLFRLHKVSIKSLPLK